MKHIGILGATLLLGVWAFDGGAAAQAYAGGGGYAGSDACKPCHEDNWNNHRFSGHPYKLHKMADVKTWALPLPAGYDWSDISYVIGGWGWKARYMDNDGYILTESPPGTPGHTQFNLATGEWVDYHAGEVKPYDCGKCHTTGFTEGGHQGGLPGIEGTWQFEGIQCEACHGPGADHVAAPSKSNITVNTNKTLCGQCHVRGDPQTEIPASGGFIRHHEQYNEILASPHKDLDCVSCHDPHKKADFAIETECVDCHDAYADTKKAFKKLGAKHMEFGLECEDCHMPYADKSAVAENKYKGDLRNHLVKISTDKNTEMFNADGSSALGVLTGEFVCLGCHTNITNKFAAADAKAIEKGKMPKSIAWARANTKKIHKKIKVK